MLDFYLKNNYVHELMPILKYTKDESKEFIKINAQLNAYAEEMSQKWILGVSDVDKDWDSYIKRLNDIGLEKAEKILANDFVYSGLYYELAMYLVDPKIENVTLRAVGSKINFNKASIKSQ